MSVQVGHSPSALQACSATSFGNSRKVFIPAWETNTPYKTGDTLKYGKEENGETGLYEVLQDHTSTEYTPDNDPKRYKKIVKEGE